MMATCCLWITMSPKSASCLHTQNTSARDPGHTAMVTPLVGPRSPLGVKFPTAASFYRGSFYRGGPWRDVASQCNASTTPSSPSLPVIPHSLISHLQREITISTSVWDQDSFCQCTESHCGSTPVYFSGYLDAPVLNLGLIGAETKQE